MESTSSEKLYSKSDLDEAYINGLECAIVVMEKALDMNYREQMLMIECLKKFVLKHRTRAVISRMELESR